MVLTVSRNLLDIGLEVAPEKTKVVNFSRKRSGTAGDVSIRVRDNVIAPSFQEKFFSLILDSRLSFGSHVAHIRGKCLKALNIIRFLCGTW